MNTRSSFARSLLSAGMIVWMISVAGCESSSGTRLADPAPPDAAVGAEIVHSRQVYVLVDGREVGVPPGTFRVRRGLGVRKVSFWQAGREVRTYTLELPPSSSRNDLVYSFFGSDGLTSTVFDSEALPGSGENQYIIPYFKEPITVEDRLYRVTLVVED